MCLCFFVFLHPPLLLFNSFRLYSLFLVAPKRLYEGVADHWSVTRLYGPSADKHLGVLGETNAVYTALFGQRPKVAMFCRMQGIFCPYVRMSIRPALTRLGPVGPRLGGLGLGAWARAWAGRPGLVGLGREAWARGPGPGGLGQGAWAGRPGPGGLG